jgi:hypothetical protein
MHKFIYLVIPCLDIAALISPSDLFKPQIIFFLLEVFKTHLPPTTSPADSQAFLSHLTTYSGSLLLNRLDNLVYECLCDKVYHLIFFLFPPLFIYPFR